MFNVNPRHKTEIEKITHINDNSSMFSWNSRNFLVTKEHDSLLVTRRTQYDYHHIS